VSFIERSVLRRCQQNFSALNVRTVPFNTACLSTKFVFNEHTYISLR
jgi:hypothetical protein